MKRCYRCGEDKELSEFNRNCKRPDGLQSACRACMKVYLRGHYEKNVPSYVARAAKSNARVMGVVVELKRKPCMDCGSTFDPVCMDFDHRPGEEKLFDVGNCRNFGLETVLAEIAKCDLVCSNCHRLRTKSRRPGTSFSEAP